MAYLPWAHKAEFSRLDRFKMFFLPTHVYNDIEKWSYIYYKVYKYRKVITYVERYR